MPLPSDVEAKIMGLGRGEAINRGFLDLFRAMANESIIDGAPSKTMILPMYDAESGLKPGDFAAELHFVLRKVSDEPEEYSEGYPPQAEGDAVGGNEEDHPGSNG